MGNSIGNGSRRQGRLLLCFLVSVLFVMLSLAIGALAPAQQGSEVSASTAFGAELSPISGLGQCAYFYYPAGWYIVGGPAGSKIPGAAGNMYTFQAGDTAYQTIPATLGVKAGYGYWAYFPTDVSGWPPQSSTDTDTVQVTLPPNQPVLIGNPFSTPASVSGVDNLTNYQPQTGTYVSVNGPMGRGQGAWAYSLTGGQATLKSICPPPP